MLVSKLAREKVTVALSADAGDELFGGYSKYTYLHNTLNKLAYLPRPLKSLAAVVLSGISPRNIPYFKNTYNFQTRYYKGIALLKATGVMDGMASIAKFFTDKEVSALLATPSANRDFFASVDLIDENFADEISQMLCTDYQTYMVDDILTKVDRAGMRVNLEGREPLLDHRLLEWSARLPSDLKIRNGTKKYILKEICHHYLPKEIMNRPKMGFGIPIVDWFDTEIRKYIQVYLNESYLLKQGIFNSNVVTRMVNEYSANKNENVFKLWNLIMFQLWYDKWMN
jgi:asparagine synthase (glutamine-hydrolysing)